MISNRNAPTFCMDTSSPTMGWVDAATGLTILGKSEPGDDEVGGNDLPIYSDRRVRLRAGRVLTALIKHGPRMRVPVGALSHWKED